MTFEQIVTLISGASQPLIFAALFIWLFTKDRDDSRAREMWFRDVVEKQRLAQEAGNELQRQQAQVMGQILQTVLRIEATQNQRGDWKKGA